MLVLTRHVHQSIVIGHDVVVTVLEVRGDQVRLGITAPKEVQVHREEVFAALTAANRQAATSATELEVLKELAAPQTGDGAGTGPPGGGGPAGARSGPPGHAAVPPAPVPAPARTGRPPRPPGAAPSSPTPQEQA